MIYKSTTYNFFILVNDFLQVSHAYFLVGNTGDKLLSQLGRYTLLTLQLVFLQPIAFGTVNKPILRRISINRTTATLTADNTNMT